MSIPLTASDLKEHDVNLTAILFAEGTSRNLTMPSDDELDEIIGHLPFTTLLGGLDSTNVLQATMVFQFVLRALAPKMAPMDFRVQVQPDQFGQAVANAYQLAINRLRKRGLMEVEEAICPLGRQEDARLKWFHEHGSIWTLAAYHYSTASDKNQRLIDYIDEDLH
jgi:hypothetical protein